MNDTKALGEWLELEARGNADDRVEEALVRVFQALPALDPGANFTRRVVEATRWSPVGARWFGHPVVRAAVALCVIQGALLIGMLPAVLSAVASSFGVPGAVTTVVNTSLAGARWALEAARISSSIGETLAGFASHPVLLATVAGCLVVSAVGLAALVRVRSSYGQPDGVSLGAGGGES